MANRGNGKKRRRLSQRGRLYLVMGLCCLMLGLSCAAALLIVGFDSSAIVLPDTQDLPAASAAPLNTETDYNKDENVIDTNAYGATILPKGKDAGESYIAETLFLGDSNTARMYRLYDYCTAANAIGSVGMSARQLATFACAGFAGYNSYQTMPNAVALLQPKRVIITFGTNDLSPGNSTENFISGYQTGIQAVQKAYPSVDIIVNAIPPLGRQRSGTSLTQTQVDEYNKGIVAMCEKNGWKFLNSAEALKDPKTGFAKDGYTESSDGIHLTQAAMDALFDYIRTHSYVTEEDRPALTAVPARSADRDVVVPQVPVVATPEPEQTPEPEETAEPESTPEPTPAVVVEPTAAPTPTPTPTPEPTPTPTPTPTPEPTPDGEAGEGSGTDTDQSGDDTAQQGGEGGGNDQTGPGTGGETDPGTSAEGGPAAE